jgi:UDP-N-acetylmuramyl pentapeptide phosphotransferase/UDP-N-acetylglucosamine-1-phosphate transferase
MMIPEPNLTEPRINPMTMASSNHAIAALLSITLLTALIGFLAIAAMLPILKRIALAHPNARSSHKVPTPQGGGIVVAAAAALVLAGMAMLPGQVLPGEGAASAGPLRHLAALGAAVSIVVIIGLLDDLHGLSVKLRLAAQAIAALLVTATLPEGIALLPPGGWQVFERVAEAGMLVCFMNITNFIDGLDEISVAHAVPAFGATGIILAGNALAPWATPLTALAAGALIGFWPWNRHVARLFLGDSGSLPLGLLLGYGVLLLLGRGFPAAAVLICLYPLADGFWTLLRRLLAGKPLSHGHREHCYQRATARGLPVRAVSGSVFLLALALAALAVLAAHASSPVAAIALVALGALLTGAVLRYFAAGFGPRP